MLCSDGRWSSITWDDRFDGLVIWRWDLCCVPSLDLTPRGGGGRVMEASFCSAVGPRVQYRDQRTQPEEPTPTASRGRNFCEMPARAAGGHASDFLVWVCLDGYGTPCQLSCMQLLRRCSSGTASGPRGAAADRCAPATAGVPVWGHSADWRDGGGRTDYGYKA